MTREEAIKKIEALFSADKLKVFVGSNVNFDGEADSKEEVVADFFSTFKAEIGQIADMIATEQPLFAVSLEGFKKGDIIYLCETDDYWPSIIRMTDDYKAVYDYFCCEVAVCNDGKWEYKETDFIDIYPGMLCRYATEEEKELFNKLKNDEV